mgnify:CR=1 FL=1
MTLSEQQIEKVINSHRVPSLRVKVTHTQTQTPIGLESPGRRQHQDARWAKRIFFWKEQFPMVNASLIGCPYASLDDKLQGQENHNLMSSGKCGHSRVSE